ncbi:hypothetical protein MRX96_053803 [Rhipicephalus microplus]
MYQTNRVQPSSVKRTKSGTTLWVCKRTHHPEMFMPFKSMTLVGCLTATFLQEIRSGLHLRTGSSSKAMASQAPAYIDYRRTQFKFRRLRLCAFPGSWCIVQTASPSMFE